MSHTTDTVSSAVVYLSHGGGPLPLLGDEGHKELVRFLIDLPACFEKPAAIIIDEKTAIGSTMLMPRSAPPIFAEKIVFRERGQTRSLLIS